MAGGGRTTIRVAACALIMAAVGSVWQGAAPAEVAAAQSDLSYSSNALWRADPAEGRVHVSATFLVTSNAVDSPNRRYFYSNLILTLPAASSEFAATTADGKPLSVVVRASSPSGVVAEVSLGRRLYAGQSTTLDLVFDIVDRGGSTDRDLRIGRNLVSFPVTAFGSPGTPGSSTTVVFPAGFSVQEEYGGLTRSTDSDGNVTYASGSLDDATALAAWFTAVEPVPASDVRTRSIVIGSVHVELRYWVDDPGWADQVERVLTSGYPILAGMIGVGDPLGTTMTVEESSSQAIGGFTGSYEELNGRVQVSYFADPFVILHETAHLWFNGRLAADRWIAEGFASYYAQQAISRLGLPDHSPKLSNRLLAASAPLDSWLSAGQPGSASEAYLYGASLQAAQEIVTVAGQDGLQRVWSQIRSGTWAYQPAKVQTAEIGFGGGTGWRGLLDYLEQTTSRSYDSIWRQWVVAPSEFLLLQQRDLARSTYTEVVAEAGTWNLPPDIRRAMDNWQFDQAISFIGQARATLSARDRITQQAIAESTSVPPALRLAFESGVAGGSQEANNELAALNALTGARVARAGSHGAPALGFLGSNPESDLSLARTAFSKGDVGRAESLANQAWAEWSGAAGAGQIRLLGAAVGTAGVLLLLVVLILTFGGRRRSRAIPLAAEAATATGFSPAGGSADAWDVTDASLPPLESVYELLQRGQALLRDQHNAQAAVVLERAARLEPAKGSIVEALGRAYYNSGQHARAAEVFETLLEIDPSAHYGHFGLGLSLERIGQEHEARAHLRLAVVMDPENAAYRRARDRIESALV